MAKIELGGLGSGYASTAKLNEQLQKIEDELNDKVLYRDNPSGEANSMSSDLDMDSNEILNVAFSDNPNSLVPKSYVDSKEQSALSQANAYADAGDAAVDGMFAVIGNEGELSLAAFAASVAAAAAAAVGRPAVLDRQPHRCRRLGPGALGHPPAPGARLSRDLAGEFRHPLLGRSRSRQRRQVTQQPLGGGSDLRRGLAQQPPRLPPLSPPRPALV